MDNRQIARVLRETAQLLEIDGAIIGRYRTYEKAAELIEGLPDSIAQMVESPDKLKELPGIGERMVEHLAEIVKTGDYSLRQKLLKKYPESILELLNLQSLGPKKVAFLFSHFQASSVDDVERIAKEGKLRDVPGFGEKSEQNILKAVEVFKRSTGRFHLHVAEAEATALAEYIQRVGKAVESVTPAGSLRRGKETVYEGKVGTLKRFKDDASEVRAGLECGIKLDDFNGYQVGDVIECYEIQKIRAAL